MVTALRKAEHKRVGVIGSLYREEERLLRRRLMQAQVLDVFVPAPSDCEHFTTMIAEELEQGIVRETSRADLVQVIYSLREAGARAVVVNAPLDRGVWLTAEGVPPPIQLDAFKIVILYDILIYSNMSVRTSDRS